MDEIFKVNSLKPSSQQINLTDDEESDDPFDPSAESSSSTKPVTTSVNVNDYILKDQIITDQILIDHILIDQILIYQILIDQILKDQILIDLILKIVSIRSPKWRTSHPS